MSDNETKKKPGRPPKVEQKTEIPKIENPNPEPKKLEAETPKTLNNVDMETLKANVLDVEVHGDPGKWLCLSKASSKAQGWMKSTKAMDIPGYGCLVQVSEQQGDKLATSITNIQGVGVYTSKHGGYRLCGHLQRNDTEE